MDRAALPKHFYLVILLMVPITGMGIDLYSPSLPWIVKALHTTPELVKLTIPMYLFGYAIGPQFYGAISDSFGRKITINIGLWCYIVTCLIVIYVPNIWVMLLMRILQGAAVGAVGITYRSLISDTVKPGPEMNRLGALMSVAWSVGPIVAPFIGGYLQHFFGWQANFVFLLIYAFVIFLMFLTIPETLQQKSPFSFKTTTTNYKIIIRHPVFWGGIVLMGITYSMIVFFNVIGPFLIQTVLHFSAIDFGHIALVMGFAFFFGGLFYRRLLKRYTVAHVLPFALGFALLTVVIMTFLSMTITLNVWVYCICTFISLFFMAGVFPAGMSKCMGLFPSMSGAANALTIFMFSNITALMTVVASFLKSNTMFPMAAAYLVFVIISMLAYFLLMRVSFKAENNT